MAKAIKSRQEAIEKLNKQTQRRKQEKLNRIQAEEDANNEYLARVEENKDEVIFEVEGSAFLPHQVRRMAGALVNLGRGFLSIEQLDQMIEGVGNGVASLSLPPQVLCLLEVKYANFPPKVGEKIGN